MFCEYICISVLIKEYIVLLQKKWTVFTVYNGKPPNNRNTVNSGPKINPHGSPLKSGFGVFLIQTVFIEKIFLRCGLKEYIQSH
jgi:hypothetical protein